MVVLVFVVAGRLRVLLLLWLRQHQARQRQGGSIGDRASALPSINNRLRNFGAGLPAGGDTGFGDTATPVAMATASSVLRESMCIGITARHVGNEHYGADNL